jgi:hypothetical protein
VFAAIERHRQATQALSALQRTDRGAFITKRSMVFIDQRCLKIVSAIRDGRAISGAHSRYVRFASICRKILLRRQFNLPAESTSGPQPVIPQCGDFTISRCDHLNAAVCHLTIPA